MLRLQSHKQKGIAWANYLRLASLHFEGDAQLLNTLEVDSLMQDYSVQPSDGFSIAARNSPPPELRQTEQRCSDEGDALSVCAHESLPSWCEVSFSKDMSLNGRHSRISHSALPFQTLASSSDTFMGISCSNGDARKSVDEFDIIEEYLEENGWTESATGLLQSEGLVSQVRESLSAAEHKILPVSSSEKFTGGSSQTAKAGSAWSSLQIVEHLQERPSDQHWNSMLAGQIAEAVRSQTGCSSRVTDSESKAGEVVAELTVVADRIEFPVVKVPEVSADCNEEPRAKRCKKESRHDEMTREFPAWQWLERLTSPLEVNLSPRLCGGKCLKRVSATLKTIVGARKDRRSAEEMLKELSCFFDTFYEMKTGECQVCSFYSVKGAPWATESEEVAADSLLRFLRACATFLAVFNGRVFRSSLKRVFGSVCQTSGEMIQRSHPRMQSLIDFLTLFVEVKAVLHLPYINQRKKYQNLPDEPVKRIVQYLTSQDSNFAASALKCAQQLRLDRSEANLTQSKFADFIQGFLFEAQRETNSSSAGPSDCTTELAGEDGSDKLIASDALTASDASNALTASDALTASELSSPAPGAPDVLPAIESRPFGIGGSDDCVGKKFRSGRQGVKLPDCPIDNEDLALWLERECHGSFAPDKSIWLVQHQLARLIIRAILEPESLSPPRKQTSCSKNCEATLIEIMSGLANDEEEVNRVCSFVIDAFRTVDSDGDECRLCSLLSIPDAPWSMEDHDYLTRGLENLFTSCASHIAVLREKSDLSDWFPLYWKLVRHTGLFAPRTALLFVEIARTLVDMEIASIWDCLSPNVDDNCLQEILRGLMPRCELAHDRLGITTLSRRLLVAAAAFPSGADLDRVTVLLRQLLKTALFELPRDPRKVSEAGLMHQLEVALKDVRSSDNWEIIEKSVRLLKYRQPYPKDFTSTIPLGRGIAKVLELVQAVQTKYRPTSSQTSHQTLLPSNSLPLSPPPPASSPLPPSSSPPPLPPSKAVVGKGSTAETSKGSTAETSKGSTAENHQPPFLDFEFLTSLENL